MATKTQIPQIQAETREQLGTRYAKRLRSTGRIPGVIYGHKQDPIHVSFDRREMTDLLHQHAHVLQVNHDTQTESCLIKDLQWDHFGRELRHIDLTRVSLDEKVTTSVSLVFHGEAVGLKEEGAILETHVTELEIECLALDIPESITVEVGELAANESLTVADLKLPEGVVSTLDPETVVAAISIQQELPEPEEEVEEGAEPEVVGKKTAEDEAETEDES